MIFGYILGLNISPANLADSFLILPAKAEFYPHLAEMRVVSSSLDTINSATNQNGYTSFTSPFPLLVLLNV